MDIITIHSNEDLLTLARGYTSLPIDMPESETLVEKEYVVKTRDFVERYRNWDRNADAILHLPDDLTGKDIWLSQPAADKIAQAIEKGEPDVYLH